MSSNQIPNDTVDHKLRFTAITLVAADGSTTLMSLPTDYIINREDKIVLRNHLMHQAWQQYLLYQKYQTDSDTNDNTDSDDDSTDDSLPPLVDID